jgi:NAD(P)-dependent dehydrogenase (short-subunit alcohol dehydrogenase family)
LAYRMAKAALNQQSITLSNELRNEGIPISIISLYPGYVATRMSRWKSKNDMATCIEGMVKVIEGLSPDQSGLFLRWDGSVIDY